MGVKLPIVYTLFLPKGSGYLTIIANNEEEVKGAEELIRDMAEDELITGIDIAHAE